MAKNPILLVRNAGHGETPIPADALLKLGDVLQIHDSNTGTQHPGKVLAIAPVGVSIDIALADQSGQPRPLMQREATHKEMLYVLDVDGRQVGVTQSNVAKGLGRAADAGMNDEAMVATIAKAIWSFNECPWDFDDPPAEEQMASLQKKLCTDQALRIVHDLATAGYRVNKAGSGAA